MTGWPCSSVLSGRCPVCLPDLCKGKWHKKIEIVLQTPSFLPCLLSEKLVFLGLKVRKIWERRSGRQPRALVMMWSLPCDQKLLPEEKRGGRRIEVTRFVYCPALIPCPPHSGRPGTEGHQQALVPTVLEQIIPFYLPQQTRKLVLGEIQILAFLELLVQIFLGGEVGTIPSLKSLHSGLAQCPAAPLLSLSPPEPLPAALLRARSDHLNSLLRTYRISPQAKGTGQTFL